MAAGSLRREPKLFLSTIIPECGPLVVPKYVVGSEMHGKYDWEFIDPTVNGIVGVSMVLQSFKKLHKLRCHIFQGDNVALERVRKEINDTYKKNKSETDLEKIKELTKFAYDVMHELKFNVVQLKEVKPGRLQVQLRPEIFEDQQGVKVNSQNVKK